MEWIHRSASKQASQIASIKCLQVGTCMRHGQESYDPKTGNEAILMKWECSLYQVSS